MTKKNELTEAENSAIRSAECVWLDRRTLAGAGVIPPDNSDITVFSRLRSAASELADAIDLLQRPAGGGEMARLLLQMQEVELYVQSQAHYRAQLDGLIEPLQLLSKATEELIVAGAPPNHAVRVWVSMAAEAWQRETGCKPTAKGRFFKALTATRLHHSIPDLTEKLVAGALQWREKNKGQNPSD